MQAWTGTTMEPFVIGSLWGNLSDDNQATLVSTGTSFHLKDNLQDVWGEVSAGVNFFNPSANTSVFAKLDVTFGDNIDGVGGKAGMRGQLVGLRFSFSAGAPRCRNRRPESGTSAPRSTWRRAHAGRLRGRRVCPRP